MIRENIRELLDREPFVPFRLVLSSGRHYDVVDPQMTVLLKSEIFQPATWSALGKSRGVPLTWRHQGDTWLQGRSSKFARRTGRHPRNREDSLIFGVSGGAVGKRPGLGMTFQLPEAIGKFPAGQLTVFGEVVRHAQSTESIPYPVAARFVQFIDPGSASKP